MRCAICGRRIRKASAVLPAVTSGPTPHPAGPVGPVCARDNGLIQPAARVSIFEVRRSKPAHKARTTIAVGRPHEVDERQLDWIEEVRA